MCSSCWYDDSLYWWTYLVEFDLYNIQTHRSHSYTWNTKPYYHRHHHHHHYRLSAALLFFQSKYPFLFLLWFWVCCGFLASLYLIQLKCFCCCRTTFISLHRSFASFSIEISLLSWMLFDLFITFLSFSFSSSFLFPWFYKMFIIALFICVDIYYYFIQYSIAGHLYRYVSFAWLRIKILLNTLYMHYIQAWTIHTTSSSTATKKKHQTQEKKKKIT